MGTWASAVTTAIAPVCWESKTFLTTVSGADSITHLPHRGYLIRTQPDNQLQATKHAEFIIRHGSKRVFILAIQAPFTEPTRKYLTDMLTPKGVTVAGSLIYDKDKTSYRSEVDQALRAKPDLLYLNGYAPEIATPDSYEAQATDWISIVALTIAKAWEANGTAIRDTVRKITNNDGAKVYTAVDGLAALKQGKEIKYSGASGPCTFTDIGDISDCKFRYNHVQNGAFSFLEVS